MRGRALQVVVVLATLTTLLATAGANEDQLHRQLDQTQQQLEAQKQRLSQTRDRLGTVREQVKASDRELARLHTELVELDREVETAQRRHEASQERTREATNKLARLTARLQLTEQRLRQRERTFDDRVAAAYKYGGQASMAEAIIESKDFTDFVTSVYYVQSVMNSDRNILAQITDDTRRVAADRAEADALREQLAAEEAEALQAKTELEELRAERQRVTAMAQAERDHRARLMRDLEANAEEAAAAVDELEAESDALTRELQRLEAERRAREAAAREAAARDAARDAPSGVTSGSGELVWPTSGRLTSRYGWRTHPIAGTRRMHTGIDISGGTGQPIVAAADGEVVSAGWRGGYGLATVIDHGGGMATLYAHQSSISVAAGQAVSAGQRIGAVGTTGYSTGPHLHFEVRINGQPQDPMRWF